MGMHTVKQPDLWKALLEAAFVSPKAPKQPQVSSLVLPRQVDGHACNQVA